MVGASPSATRAAFAPVPASPIINTIENTTDVPLIPKNHKIFENIMIPAYTQILFPTSIAGVSKLMIASGIDFPIKEIKIRLMPYTITIFTKSGSNEFTNVATILGTDAGNLTLIPSLSTMRLISTHTKLNTNAMNNPSLVKYWDVIAEIAASSPTGT